MTCDGWCATAAAVAQLPVSGDEGYRVLLWIALAFGLWLILCAAMRRYRLPRADLAAATLSWLVARLFIWAAPLALHEIRSWFG